MKKVRLESVNFKPKDELDDYLINEFNFKIYRDLTKEWDSIAGLKFRAVNPFEPLQFFNLLYEKFEFIESNFDKPSSLLNHFNNLSLSKEQLWYLLDHLLILLSEAYPPEVFLRKKDQRAFAFKLLDDRFKQLNWELGHLNKKSYETQHDYEMLKIYYANKNLETLSTNKEKLDYLTEMRKEHEKEETNHKHLDEVEEGTPSGNFIRWCNKQIEKYEEVEKTETNKLEVAPEAMNLETAPEAKDQVSANYHNSELVLIFYYFFKYNGLELRKNIDIAPVAKFMHLITGNEFTTTANSDFYTRLKKAPNFNKDKSLIKDLNSIKPLFKDVKLHEIVKYIDNEIDTAHKEAKY